MNIMKVKKKACIIKIKSTVFIVMLSRFLLLILMKLSVKVRFLGSPMLGLLLIVFLDFKLVDVNMSMKQSGFVDWKQLSNS